ncbi:MAG: MFS transporter [Rhizomicrobium sp.]
MSIRQAGKPHPIVYLILCIPFGVTSGYVSVTLGFLLAHAGVSVGAISALVAFGLLPQTWKAAWAPVVDTTLTSKQWYLIGAAVSALAMIATGLFPVNAQGLQAITVLVFLFNVSISFLAMAAENLMAHSTGLEEKGRAGGWYQAGNLGGYGVGGGLALWIAEHSTIGWLPGAAMGVLFLLCCAALFFVDEPSAEHRQTTYAHTLRDLIADLWQTARSRAGYLALLICFLPIGSGAATNLWGAVASDWHADANTVALANGVLGGFISMAGCLIGGYLCDRMERRFAYALFGIALAVVTLAMAAAARSATMFVVFTLAYNFVQGFNYASFSAVVLEAIGRGAAATKYNLYASLSNIPIAYIGLADGWAHDHWGSMGFLLTDALSGLVAVGVFFAIAAATRPRVAATA